MQQRLETFLGCGDSYEESPIVIFGAPFDSTTSYRPGTRFASKVMRSESYGLETYSPSLDLDLDDESIKIFDAGDLELPFGNTERSLQMIEANFEEILKDRKIPFMLGGEHLVTLAGIRAVKKFFDDVSIIHFDAHTDLREDYLGEKLSHACVIRRAWDLVGDGRIYQFGIRSGLREEFEFAREHTFLQKFTFEHLDEVVSKLRGRKVYFTIDLDVLDPSVFPGTGTPEAGGVSFVELLKASMLVVQNLDVVACDLVELSPPYDPSGISTATALKIFREMLLAISARNI